MIKKQTDIERYIENQKRKNPSFAKNYDTGHLYSKIGVLLKQARKATGYTQEEVAKKLNTGISAISRIESGNSDIRLTTVENFVKALGKKIEITIS